MGLTVKGLSRRYPPALKYLGLIILVVLSVSLLNPHREPASEPVVSERTFVLSTSVTYECNGTETWNLTEEDYTIGLFSNNSWQTVYVVNCSFPISSFKTDEDGNYVAVLDIKRKQLFPNTTLSYRVEYKIVTKPRSVPDLDERFSLNLSDIPEKMREEFHGAAGPWQVDDSEIVDLAHEIAGNETKTLTLVKKFVTWIKDNIGYKTSDLPRYPNETLKERLGDCDDQANLLITFCRAYGIPAYLQIGCIYQPNKVNEISRFFDGHLVTNSTRIGWHGWAMVYVPPWGWLPVDLTYAQDVSADILNMIKKSAITLQETVLYMNVTTSDYVASSKSLKNLLEEHNFYVYEADEMMEESAIIKLVQKSELSTDTLAAVPLTHLKLFGEDL